MGDAESQPILIVTSILRSLLMRGVLAIKIKLENYLPLLQNNDHKKFVSFMWIPVSTLLAQNSGLFLIPPKSSIDFQQILTNLEFNLGVTKMP